MAETLAAGSAVTDAFGAHAKVETRAHWTPDQTFFELMRDRASVNAMLAEVAGKKAADKLVSAKLKDQKAALAAAASQEQHMVPRLDAFSGDKCLIAAAVPALRARRLFSYCDINTQVVALSGDKKGQSIDHET